MSTISKETLKIEKQRLQHIDLVSGLLIIQIILMHILLFAHRYEGNPLFSVVMHLSFFFMPWFYFKSGYFYKSPGRVDRTYIKKKAQKLLIPYITFFIIGFIISFPFEVYEAQRPVWRMLLTPGYQFLRYGGGGAGNAPLWFLLSLFFTIAGYAFLDLFKLKSIITGFPVISYLLFHFDITLPLGISNLFLGIFFFWAGNIFKKIENKHKKTILIISLAIYSITQLCCFSSLGFRTNILRSGYYFVYIISALSGLALFYYGGKWIKILHPVNYIGKESLIYFIAHWPIMVLIKNTYKILSMETTGYVYALLLTLSVFLIIPICIKLLKKESWKTWIGKQAFIL